MTRRSAAILGLLLLQAGASAQDVQVRSSESRKAPSALLRHPGTKTSQYGPDVDWSEVPPWRQTSFYGVRAEGKVFIFVVDCSGSMAAQGRLERAKIEIRRSVLAMRHPQKFHVIFYDDQPRPMPAGIPQAADSVGKDRLLGWLRMIEPDGGTDPRGAMTQALSMKPDGIFLLSDGEFPDGTAESIARANKARIPIHCIDLSGGSGNQLRRIAQTSGGQYAARTQ